MEENKVHFRHLMLFFIGKAKMPHKRQTRYVYGESVETVRKWFARFKADNFNLEDQDARVGPPPQVKIRLKH